MPPKECLATAALSVNSDAESSVESLSGIELALLDGKNGEQLPPKEFRIFKAGENRTKKGTFIFDEQSAASVKAAADDWANDFSIDYEHAALKDHPEGAPAAAWFKPETRNGELWATQVDWTTKATSRIAAREYRYVSPTFRHDKDGRIRELINVALTNIPATKGMKPLVLSTDVQPPPTPESKPMKHLLAALALVETATETDALAAITKLKAEHSQLAALTGKDNIADGMAMVMAWKAGSAKAEALSARVAELEKAKATAEVESVLAEAKKAGKVPPALEPELRKMELSSLKAFVAAMPVIANGSATGEPTQGKGTESLSLQVTDDDKRVAALCGIPLEKVLAERKAHGGQILSQETTKSA